MPKPSFQLPQSPDFVDIYRTDKKFDVIYADPPWMRRKDTADNPREWSNKYDLQTTKYIANMPVKDIAADDSILFMWSTYTHLIDMLVVMEGWGFEYLTNGFVWVKLNKSSSTPFMGMGHYTRSNSEPLWMGIKGKPHKLVKDKTISQIIKATDNSETGVFESPNQVHESQIEKHSKKPIILRDRIKHLLHQEIDGRPVEYLEMFAREHAKGWSAFGNELQGYTLPPEDYDHEKPINVDKLTKHILKMAGN